MNGREKKEPQHEGPGAEPVGFQHSRAAALKAEDRSSGPRSRSKPHRTNETGRDPQLEPVMTCFLPREPAG